MEREAYFLGRPVSFWVTLLHNADKLDVTKLIERVSELEKALLRKKIECRELQDEVSFRKSYIRVPKG